MEQENINPEVLDAEEAKREFNQGKNKEKKQRSLSSILLESFIQSLPLYLLIAYICCGCCIKTPLGVNQLNGWQSFYPLLILMPTSSSLVLMVKKKKLSYFPMIFFVTSAYCFIGMFTNLWHPYWALFFIVPVFAGLAAKIDSICK